MSVKYKDNTKKMINLIEKNIEDEALNIVLDLKRTASESAPHKTGNLEKSFYYEYKYNGKSIYGEVGVSAINSSGEDYAVRMHDEDYNLGEQSKRKPGGKSAYGGGTIKVGKGYLENSMNEAENGYIKAIKNAFEKSIE